MGAAMEKLIVPKRRIDEKQVLQQVKMLPREDFILNKSQTVYCCYRRLVIEIHKDLGWGVSG